MPFCEKCGGSIEPGSKFCDNCGVPIDDPSTAQPASLSPPPQAPTFHGPSPAPTAPPASAPIPPIYIAAGIAVVVIIIALVFASGAISGHPGPGVPPTVTVTPRTIVTTLPVTTKVVANPASEYCGQVGGETAIGKDKTGAEYGMCIFPDMTSCEEWALFRGECKPTSSVKTTTLPVTTMAVPGTGSASDWNNMGDRLYFQKDYQGALYAFEKAIALDPNDAGGWNNKGRALNGLGRYSEALIATEKAIALDPNDAWGWNNKGVQLEDLKRYPEALIAYETAIALEPTYQNAIANKKNLEAKMNK